MFSTFHLLGRIECDWLNPEGSGDDSITLIYSNLHKSRVWFILLVLTLKA
jgi:hypothetical protein